MGYRPGSGLREGWSLRSEVSGQTLGGTGILACLFGGIDILVCDVRPSGGAFLPLRRPHMSWKKRQARMPVPPGWRCLPGPYFSPTHQTCPAVRRKICPSETAGVELLASPRSLVANRRNSFGSAAKTTVTPALLVTYKRSPTATIEPQNCWPLTPCRQISFPVATS